MIAGTVAVKERPILFSTEMVKAILAGRKTQTRRVCKFRITGPNPPSDLFDMYDADKWIGAFPNGDKLSSAATNCPYGVPGDRLWVRETFLAVGGLDPEKARIVYRASNEGPDQWVSPVWKPSIFMPRWASRITLEITKIRVERVKEISHRDIAAEGVDFWSLESSTPFTYGQHKKDFEILWDKINAKRGFGWDTNPWVWVIEFKSL